VAGTGHVSKEDHGFKGKQSAMTIAKNKGARRTGLLRGTTTCHHRDMNLGMELSDEVREGHSTGRAHRSRPSREPAEPKERELDAKAR
jgi:hypothetical protein